MPLDQGRGTGLNIAVIGTGISGLAAAWLLAQRHKVTVFEQASRVGGHSNTVKVYGPKGPISVDTGFVVYNERTYPNLMALFDLLKVPTQESAMSFSVSLDDGALEYAGTGLGTFFAQPRNLFRPAHWLMLREILRFYREAPALIEAKDRRASFNTLGAYLERHGYSEAFARDHLLPMAAAIWSTPLDRIRDHEAASFAKFFQNHGLLTLRDRPAWRTVIGGSTQYVRRLTAGFNDSIRTGCGAARISRGPDGVVVYDTSGGETRFDHVVIATHADQALRMLDDPSPEEASVLSEFRYQSNRAILHGDPRLMPRRRAVWSSWNYIGRRDGPAGADVSVTYWMNRLQQLPPAMPLFVSLNPVVMPRAATVHAAFDYDHPLYDARAVRAQKRLWPLQGQRNTWYCGAYFGAGFHEDGLQAGLAVAEELGGQRRPWTVPEKSGRIAVAA